MKEHLNFSGKFLLLLLMLIGLGGNLSFGASAEFRPLHKTSEKNFHAVQPVVALCKENNFREFPEPSEDLFFGNLSANFQETVSLAEEATRQLLAFGFKRDLRTEISRQIFPTHFFL
ncbi:MAG: hypothetical protein WBL27_02420 [Salinimicrobium sp.]